MSVIPGREDKRRDTISMYLASLLAQNPSQFRTTCPEVGRPWAEPLHMRSRARTHTHTRLSYLGTPVKGEIRLLSLGLSFPQGTCQEGAR